MHNDTRYADINAITWPPITRQEAASAAYRISKHFGSTKDGSPAMLYPYRYRGGTRGVRRCWISPVSTCGNDKGWGRLIHDLGHSIFRRRHPSFRPHDGGHAKLEREIAFYVLAQSWHTGTLRPAAKPKPSLEEKRAARLSALDAGMARWLAKRNRADRAIRRLKGRRAALLRAIKRSQARPVLQSSEDVVGGTVHGV